LFRGNLGNRDISPDSPFCPVSPGSHPQKPNSGGNNGYDDGILIPLILKTVLENTPCLNVFLTSTLRKKLKIPKSEGKRFSDKVRYLIKKLERHGFIITKRISKRLYEIFPAPISSQSSKADTPTKMALDLINRSDARNSHEGLLKDENSNEKADIKHAYDVVATPPYSKAHKIWFKLAVRYWKKHKLTKDDIEEITEYFEAWKDDVSEKVMLFLRPGGEIEVKDYKTRFTSKSEAYTLLRRADEIFNNAFKQYDKAIFLTITLPRCFPMKIAMYILTFLHHRVKAYIRKETGEKTPHFRVNEPQNDLYPHVHTIIFGTDWLMPKHELTRYLDKHLENFLKRMGDHYKQTINKRATEKDVKSLNKLGKRLLKKYKRYKAKHPKYEGVINWITRVKIEDGQAVFENPPPDYSFGSGSQKTMPDGGNPTVKPYVTKYLLKNAISCSLGENGESNDSQNSKLAFYWLMRVPFFTYSNSLRPVEEKPPPAGWIFLTSCYEVNLQDALEYAEWLLSKGYV